MRIVTDSAADFESGELRSMGVASVPLCVRFGGREYHEGVDLDKAAFWKLVAEGGACPRTSQAGPFDFRRAFETAARTGEETVAITESSAMSGSYQGALLACDLLGDVGCRVVDGRTVAAGQRILVEHAVALRDAGASADEVVAGVEGLRPRVEVDACLGTLGYLRRGGRISRREHAMGSLAGTRPFVRMTDEGWPLVVGKPCGVRRSLRYLLGRLAVREPDPAFPLYVMYADDRADGEMLAVFLRDHGYDVPDGRIVQVGAAVGSHAGPGSYGIAYVSVAEPRSRRCAGAHVP